MVQPEDRGRETEEPGMESDSAGCRCGNVGRPDEVWVDEIFVVDAALIDGEGCRLPAPAPGPAAVDTD